MCRTRHMASTSPANSHGRTTFMQRVRTRMPSTSKAGATAGGGLWEWVKALHSGESRGGVSFGAVADGGVPHMPVVALGMRWRAARRLALPTSGASGRALACRPGTRLAALAGCGRPTRAASTRGCPCKPGAALPAQQSPACLPADDARGPRRCSQAAGLRPRATSSQP